MVGPTQVVQAPPMQQIVAAPAAPVYVQAPQMQQVIAEAAAPVYIQSQQMQAPQVTYAPQQQVIETIAAPQMTYAAPQMTYAAPQMTYAAPQMMETFAAPTQFVETMAA